jgi:hypothetical protein
MIRGIEPADFSRTLYSSVKYCRMNRWVVLWEGVVLPIVSHREHSSLPQYNPQHLIDLYRFPQSCRNPRNPRNPPMERGKLCAIDFANTI